MKKHYVFHKLDNSRRSSFVTVVVLVGWCEWIWVDFDEIHLHVWISSAMIPDCTGSKDPGNQRIDSLAFNRGSEHPKRISTREVTTPQRRAQIKKIPSFIRQNQWTSRFPVNTVLYSIQPPSPKWSDFWKIRKFVLIVLRKLEGARTFPYAHIALL